MDYKAFQDELIEVLVRYGKDIACLVFGIAYIDEEGNLRADGMSLIPCPPKDHEEQLLRDACAKEASKLVQRLTENTYLDGGE